MRHARGSGATSGYAVLVLALLAVSLAPLVRAECTNLGEHTEREGEFSTQPEGEVYAASLDCHWHIRPADMAAGECVVIHVDVMDTDDEWDFLYVTSPNSTFTVTGWYDDPFVLETLSSEVDIVFQSSEDPWGDEGVVARWTVEPCSVEDVQPAALCPNTGMRRERSGELQMIDDSSPYDTLQPSMVCDWTIEPPLEAGECITSEIAYADFSADDGFVYGTLSMDSTALPIPRTPLPLRKTGASARQRLHLHVATLPENEFATQSRGMALSWWVVPCASVADRLPLLPGEPADTVRVVGDNGTVFMPFLWRRTGYHSRLQIVFANPKFATDENTCMDLRVHTNSLRASLESRFFTREAVWSGDYTIVGASNMSLIASTVSGGAALLDYRVHACPGAVAIAQKSNARCKQLGDELMALGFQSRVERSSPCCMRWMHRSSEAVVHLVCQALSGPIRISGVMRIPAATEHVWSFIRDTGIAEVSLVHVTIPASGIPSNITNLQVEGLYGTNALDLRYMEKLERFVLYNWEAGETVHLPPSCKSVDMANTRASLANLEELVELQLVSMNDMGMAPIMGVWAATVTSLTVTYAQVEHLPLHEGLISLKCIRCGVSEPPASLPSTLEYLDLSGNMLTGMLPPLPSGIVRLTCDSCGLVGTFTTLSPCSLHALSLRANELTALDVSHCLFLYSLEVARNHDLEAIGALPGSLRSLAVSDTHVPQPDAESLLNVEELDAENVPTFNKPFYLSSVVHTLRLSGSPVGRIIMRGVASFLFTLHAENCELTEFPLPVVEDHATFLTLLSELRLAHNRIRHVPQGALPVEYQVVDLSHNELESVGLYTLNNQPRGSLDLSHNKLTTLGDVVSVVYLDVSHNRLTSLPRLHATIWLDASHNQLSTVALPISAHLDWDPNFTDSRRTTLLDLSYNNITTVRDVLLMEEVDVVRLNNNALVEMDLPTVALRELDVSHNRLENLEAVVMRFGRSASVLNVGHNSLHRADALHDLPPTVHTLQLDHNKFSGSLPQLSHLPKLASLDLHHSGFGVDASECDDVTSHECIGPSLTAVEYRTADNERMACPVYGLTHNPDVIVDMDPAEYGTSAVCKCIFGFYGFGGECKRCPANALCSDVYVVPERGFWNHIHIDRRGAPADALVQQCVSYTTTATCSPDNSLATFVQSLDAGTVRDMPRCSPGHTGRMCAACEDDHFEWGDRCSKCPNGAGVFFLLAASFLIVAAAVTYAYKVKPGTNASLKVLVFFTQTIQLARTTGVQMDNRVASVLDFFSGFMIELPGIECVWRGYGLREDTFAAMTMPLWACAIVMAVYAVGASRARDGVAAWWDRNVGALLLLNFMLYLRVASSVLSPLRCETDPFLGHRYFAVSPSDLCDDTVVGVSAVMVAVYVLLVPVVLAIVLFRHRHSLGDDRTSTRFRFLYATYRQRYWYWEGVITLRKLAILTIMASSARSSVAVPLGVFLVLVLSAVLQDRIKPFAESRDNAMEYTSLWTLAVLFVLLTASTVPGVHMPLWVGVMVALLQFFFVVGVLVIMLQRHRGSLKRKLPSFVTNTFGRKTSSGLQESGAQDALLGGESDRQG